MHAKRWAVLAVTVATTISMTAVAHAGSGSAAPTATDVGVTADEIHIGVIADVDNALYPGFFAGSVAGVEGAAKYLNKQGGLAGRKIVIDFHDSKLNADEARNAVIAACEQDFAIVGTSALFLANVDDLVGCKDAAGKPTGLPDVPVVVTEVPQQCSPVSFPINPPALDCRDGDPASADVPVQRPRDPVLQEEVREAARLLPRPERPEGHLGLHRSGSRCDRAGGRGEGR